MGVAGLAGPHRLAAHLAGRKSASPPVAIGSLCCVAAHAHKLNLVDSATDGAAGFPFARLAFDFVHHAHLFAVPSILESMFAGALSDCRHKLLPEYQPTQNPPPAAGWLVCGEFHPARAPAARHETRQAKDIDGGRCSGRVVSHIGSFATSIARRVWPMNRRRVARRRQK